LYSILHFLAFLVGQKDREPHKKFKRKTNEQTLMF